MFKVDNAIILAAGIGSRFVPITYEIPKGLIPVRGEPLLERQIRQLKEKGVHEIFMVVGYMREKFDYLSDKYGVQLVYNPEYAVKNNLSSLYCVREHLKNTYILSADNWIKENIFSMSEEKSWYSCVYHEGLTSEWCVQTDHSGRITGVTIGGSDSWVMYGPVFLSRDFTKSFAGKIGEYYKKDGTQNYMWENVFIDEINTFKLFVNRQSRENIYEFESLEELRLFDPRYHHGTPNTFIKTIQTVFNVNEDEIVDIQIRKIGMTNKSFVFSVHGKPYIFRSPGEGAEKLINRKQEKEVYKTIKNLNVSDNIIFFDENTGFKISFFHPDAASTCASNGRDVFASMNILRSVHQSGLKVNHSFDIGKEITNYLALCYENNAVLFSDNSETFLKAAQLIQLLEKMNIPKTLCHIDSNPDNFIKLENGAVKLIDWEYAGMSDPLIDVAMYSIYSYYTKEEMDELLKTYLQREPQESEFFRLYAYAALGGYLWTLWSQYKKSFGAEFGEYCEKMYNYAKNFPKNFRLLKEGE